MNVIYLIHVRAKVVIAGNDKFGHNPHVKLMAQNRYKGIMMAFHRGRYTVKKITFFTKILFILQ